MTKVDKITKAFDILDSCSGLMAEAAILEDIRRRMANNQTVSEHEVRLLERHIHKMKAPSL